MIHLNVNQQDNEHCPDNISGESPKAVEQKAVLHSDTPAHQSLYEQSIQVKINPVVRFNLTDSTGKEDQSNPSEFIAEGVNELRIECQNAPVLSSEELTAHAQQMEQSRYYLTQLLVNSSLGLPVMAREFLRYMTEGIDISELLSKNNSELNEPAQDESCVQDTVKQLESKLRSCFELAVHAEKNVNLAETFLECRPNFLQQVVAVLTAEILNEPLSESDEQWIKALHVQQSRMISSRQAMINGNLRLVTFIARQYNFQSMSFNDLIQDGTIGLIKAVDRYDWRRAVRFSTYAIYWIRQTISRAMVRQEKMVRLPYNIAAKATAVFETMNTWLVQNNKWPSTAELAVSCNMPEQEVKAIVEYYQPTVSLDGSINDDEDMPELIATMEQHHYPQPLNSLTSSALKKILRKAVGTLPEREADIINCRFGLDNDHEMTLQDIADKMSLTRERVRQIQNSALSKLKANFSGDLKDFLEPG